VHLIGGSSTKKMGEHFGATNVGTKLKIMREAHPCGRLTTFYLISYAAAF